MCNLRNKLLKLFSILLLVLVMITRVDAKVAFSGETVNQEGEYDSSIFVAGNNLTDKSTVDGIKFLAGNSLEAKGTSSYAFYAGNIVTINSTIEKDLFAAGNSVTIGSEAVLGRDVYIAGSTVKINVNVPRNLRAGGTSVDLKGITINGSAYVMADEILLDENTIIEGKFTYPKDSKVEGLDVAHVSEKKAIDYNTSEEKTSFKEIVWSFIISVFAGFVVLIALFRFIPESKNKLDKLEVSFDSVIKRGCTGLIVLLVVPIICLFALISGILTPISLIVLAVYVISIYLSFIVVSYIIGRLLLTKVFKKDNLYLMMFLGLIVLKLIKYIPIIGGVIYAIAMFYGLGLIYKFITVKRNNK